MITLKEIGGLIIALLILAFSYSFINPDLFLQGLVFFAVILTVYVAAKKFMAYYFESEEETKIWTFQRYGIYERSYLKTPVPLGIILPFFLTILSLGLIPWYAVTESDVKPTTSRVARRHEFYSYSELTEWHIGLISAAGVLACFILAFFAYFLDYGTLSKLSIFFAAFNLIPLGKLDGTRIVFGSRILYFMLVAVTILGLTYAFLMP